MSTASKQIKYRAILDKFEHKFGTAHTRNQTKHVIFSVTGDYRNKLHGEHVLSADLIIYVALFAIMSVMWSAYLAGFVTLSVWVANSPDLDDIFDGAIMEIDGVSMGVVIMTQKEEGEWESRNFVETNDESKLLAKLNECKLVYSENKVVTWSIGSNTGQCIDNQSLAPFNEVEMGVDMFSDEDITRFMDAHAKSLDHDGVLVFMNSAGYGVTEDGGIVYSDNTMECATILDNVVPRQVGGTGNNANAMKFVELCAKIHARNKYDFTFAIVPRGDKTMPQGGSHSKQRVLEHFLNGEDIVVIEASGKQTKKFELPADTGSSVMDSAEDICKRMKEAKVMDGNGKTHGSQSVFGK
jgi:hypothetical protein